METQRAGLARTLIGISSSISRSFCLAQHTLDTQCQQKVALAVHHLHLDTLPTLPSHSGRACSMGHYELASALVMANLSCGMVLLLLKSNCSKMPKVTSPEGVQNTTDFS